MQVGGRARGGRAKPAITSHVQIVEEVAADPLSRSCDLRRHTGVHINRIQAEPDPVERAIRREIDSVDFSLEGGPGRVRRAGYDNAAEARRERHPG
jgi:hypothetical protein